MIQIAIGFVSSGGEANEKLRIFQKENPKRKIISVSIDQQDPHGFYMTITYEIDMKI